MSNPQEAVSIVKALVERAVELNIDFDYELSQLGDGPFSARQVVNAIGAAATRLKIPNNLVKVPVEFSPGSTLP